MVSKKAPYLAKKLRVYVYVPKNRKKIRVWQVTSMAVVVYGKREIAEEKKKKNQAQKVEETKRRRQSDGKFRICQKWEGIEN